MIDWHLHLNTNINWKQIELILTSIFVLKWHEINILMEINIATNIDGLKYCRTKRKLIVKILNTLFLHSYHINSETYLDVRTIYTPTYIHIYTCPIFTYKAS